MNRLVFAGCSFTHSGDSWAYQPQPNNTPHVEVIDEPGGHWGNHLLREQSEWVEKLYGIKNAFDTATFWTNSHKLPKNLSLHNTMLDCVSHPPLAQHMLPGQGPVPGRHATQRQLGNSY